MSSCRGTNRWGTSVSLGEYWIRSYHNHRNFFNKHLSQQGLLSTSTWLTLTAANGLDIPYVGYCEADVECCGKSIEKRGILVVQDPPNASSQRRKATVPGLLGRNVIGKCQDILKQDFGSCYIEQMTTEWNDVFQAVTH